ncbi:MAG TPA: hypothetical protein VFR73_00725, partial [Hyphomicrobiaceae bacterium]|nr:hypothetical protein [Hyphomicrobiaceae bacterium]
MSTDPLTCSALLRTPLVRTGAIFDMLKKCVRHALAGMAMVVLASAAHADGPYRRGPGPGPAMMVLEPPPIFTWSGFYIGGNIGAAWSNSTLTDDASVLSYSQSHSGFIGGGQLGY